MVKGAAEETEAERERALGLRLVGRRDVLDDHWFRENQIAG